jgi:energy-converting hydrogenase Eha subunit E
MVFVCVCFILISYKHPKILMVFVCVCFILISYKHPKILMVFVCVCFIFTQMIWQTKKLIMDRKAKYDVNGMNI